MRLVLLIIFCTLAHSSLAQPVVNVLSGMASSSFTETAPGSGKYDLDIQIPNGQSSQVFIQVLISTGTFGEISINNNGNIQAASIDIGSVSNRISSAESINQTGSQPARFRIYATGDIGELVCDDLYFAIIGGDITGPWLIRGLAPEIDAITQTFISGSVLDDITVIDGFINGLTVSGTIGTPTSPVTISAGDAIGRTTAAAIYADVYTTDLVRIETTSGNFVGNIVCDFLAYSVNGLPLLSVAGDYIGTITTGKIDPPLTSQPVAIEIDGDFIGDLIVDTTSESEIRIAGDLDGTFDIGGNLLAPIIIGGSLTSTGSITADFIESQIILNADNDANTWDGDINLLRGGYPITLAGPNYTNTPFQIGGGAVGLAPFNIHDQACQPVNGANLTGFAAILNGFQINHYGPILGVNGADPVTVWRKTDVPGVPFIECTSSFDIAATANGRGLILTWAAGGEIPPGFTYRVQPGESLLCNNVAGNPPVASWTYEVSIFDPFDMNMDGYICALDIDEWLLNPIDINGDDIADANDLAELVLAVAEQ